LEDYWSDQVSSDEFMLLCNENSLGVVFILAAYLLLQVEEMRATSAPHLIANGLGAFLILISLVNESNLSVFIIEAAWLLISVYGLIRCLKKRCIQTAIKQISVTVPFAESAR